MQPDVATADARGRTRADTVVTFSVSGSLFAVEVGIVQEILSPQEPTRLPNAPAYLLGLIDVRGASVPLVDLRCLLGEPMRDEDENTRILLLALTVGGRQHRVAMRVDQVIEVAALDDDGRIDPVHEAEMLSWDPRAIWGIGRRDGVITTLLNADTIFDPAVIVAARSRSADKPAGSCPS
ncbi:chemotaxis protein CheW [Mesobacterium pallidum]|uniref:chemotaxis protein CheW n=1 Tax=Mesobacterium pallidum TaxID=2872037 RepID=UPI001EE15CF0|nr:chemotaxis protein CheW [Mesobacterium pallidum]